MKKKLYVPITFAIIFLSFIFSNAYSQCPARIDIISTNITTATCPSNGGFTINANIANGVIYQITNGPVGYPSTAQLTPAFTELLPGNYTIKVACQSDESIYTTAVITIPSNYVQVAAASTVTNICGSNTPGGTINTTVNAGSSTPFSYAYWQGDPAAADASLTYAVTNTYTALTFGTYNVRTKDACGVYVTQQVTIANTYAENLCLTDVEPRYRDLSCTQLQDSIWVELTGGFLPFSSLPTAGIDIDVYINSGGCANPVQGNIINTIHYDNTSTDNFIKIPNGQNLLFKVRTPCGNICTYCYRYNPTNTGFQQNTFINSAGCVGTDEGIPYQITVNANSNSVFPITWIITNDAGTTVGGFTANTAADLPHVFNNLPPGRYSSAANDGCGGSSAVTLQPASGPANQLSVAYSEEYVGCESIEGRTKLKVLITGAMANLANATVTIIAPSPNLIGIIGEQSNEYYIWPDAIPNATYFIEVDNGCGQKDTVSVSNPTVGPGILVQHTNATIQQLCGGTGNILINAAYNGDGNFLYKIINSNGTVVGNGTLPGGTHSNLPAGTYIITTYINGCSPYSYSSTVSILPNGSGPSIIKKLGFICEDANGNPTATGSALFLFNGAPPLKVDYRLTTATDADYINTTNNSSGRETITGLLANTSYTIRITDICGNSSVTQLSIGQLGAINIENRAQPCPGGNYTLSVPDMVDATYVWTKNDVTISNNRSIIFPSYSSGDDGLYVCRIVIAGCVVRMVSVTLTSTECGGPVPIKLTSFTAKKQNNTVLLNWQTSTETNNHYFDIQHSTDGVHWQFLGKVSTANNSATAHVYSFTHTTPAAGINYYRLQSVDNNNQTHKSDIRTVLFGKNGGLLLLPNPVSDMLYITGNLTLMSNILLLSAEGKILAQYSNLPSGAGIKMQQYPTGMYWIKITDAYGNTETKQVFKK